MTSFVQKVFFTIVAFNFFSSPLANASFLIHWDCNLPNDRIDCFNLKRDFLGSVPALQEVTNPAHADLSIKIIVNKLSGQASRIYSVAFHGQDTLPTFTVNETINDSIASGSAYNVVLGNLQKGIVPYLKIQRFLAGPQGQTTITLTDPFPQRQGHRQAPSAPSNWYFSPSASAHLTHNSVTSIDGFGGFEFSYSNPNWRFRGGVEAIYQKLMIPGIGGRPSSEAEFFTYGGRTVIVRSVRRGWSVAVLGLFGHSPTGNEDNLTGLVNASAGAEWDLVPFRRNSENNIGVRFVVGAENQWFHKPNINNYQWQTYMKNSLQIYAAWHLSAIDINARIVASNAIDSVNPDRWFLFSTLSGNVAITYRVTDNLRIGTHFTVAYRTGLINEPRPQTGPINSSDSAAQFLGAGNYGDLNYVASLSLTYVFGNTLLPTQDMRWSSDLFP